MIPVMFEGVNAYLGKPEGMADADCGGLPVERDGQGCTSCWEMTAEELAEVIRTKRVYVYVLSGMSQPPMNVSVR